jgi:hypothetical protein
MCHITWTAGPDDPGVAFGLGIDKGNVRFVLHHTVCLSFQMFSAVTLLK